MSTLLVWVPTFDFPGFSYIETLLRINFLLIENDAFIILSFFNNSFGYSIIL